MPPNIESIHTEYQSHLKTWEHLRDEAVFILEHELEKASIKYHTIAKRIKAIGSIIEKADRQEKENPLELTDIVGLRVVCLFLSDIKKVASVIRQTLNVLSEDDKIEEREVSSFGYMSVHFIAQLKTTYSGPRYDSVKNIPFEIQVRTIAMDAWAATSHYLDYKSEEDVPKELRKDFFALSGLFYLADQHFEMFFRARLESKRAVAKELKHSLTGTDIKLNFDTLQEYLKRQFPDRHRENAKAVSDLLTELKEVGFETIADVDTVVQRTREAVLRFQEQDTFFKAKGGGRAIITGVGMVRYGLRMLNKEYAANFKNADITDPYKEFVKPA